MKIFKLPVTVMPLVPALQAGAQLLSVDISGTVRSDAPFVWSTTNFTASHGEFFRIAVGPPLP